MTHNVSKMLQTALSCWSFCSHGIPLLGLPRGPTKMHFPPFLPGLWTSIEIKQRRCMEIIHMIYMKIHIQIWYEYHIIHIIHIWYKYDMYYRWRSGWKLHPSLDLSSNLIIANFGSKGAYPRKLGQCCTWAGLPARNSWGKCGLAELRIPSYPSKYLVQMGHFTNS